MASCEECEYHWKRKDPEKCQKIWLKTLKIKRSKIENAVLKTLKSWLNNQYTPCLCWRPRSSKDLLIVWRLSSVWWGEADGLVFFRTGLWSSSANEFVHCIPWPSLDREFNASRKLIPSLRDLRMYKHKCPHVFVPGIWTMSVFLWITCLFISLAFFRYFWISYSVTWP